MINHALGIWTCFQGMTIPSYLSSEKHLQKFPDQTEFQSSVVDIRAEVYAEARNLALVLQWINKIEAASSLKDLVNPKSITGKDFYDYEELDLMMAAEMKWCYDRYSYFQKRIRVKEQRAQKDNRFLRGSQIAYLIYDIRERGAVTKGKGQKFLHRAEDWRMFFGGRLLDIVQTLVVFYTRMPRETVRQRGKEMEDARKSRLEQASSSVKASPATKAQK